MRTHPRYTRVRNMLTAIEVPRRVGGGIALCHLCQRSIYFAGGFLLLVAKELRTFAKFGHSWRLSGANSGLLTRAALSRVSEEGR